MTLTLDIDGDPQLQVTRNGRTLKAVPARVKKEPEIAGLLQRRKEIRQQVSRSRLSLEQAMCRGDSFSGAELRQLLSHPVLRPRLEQLVFVGDGVMGYPAAGGETLAGINGRVDEVGSQIELRIAHPYDLLQTEEWHLW